MYLSREDVVREFHKKFKHPVAAEPVTSDLLELRHKLIYEEYTELRDEMAAAMADVEMYGEVTNKTKARMVKEMADLQYVLSGLAVALDLPLQVAFVRVHQSNLSKLGEDGEPILREDGKVLKGPNYAPPDMESLFETTPGYEYY
jgi:predicted HAD superfamily Cof-like phosphohydrolase